MNLALVVLNQVLGLVATIRGQSGLTDDAILAEAQKVTAGNDDAYNALVAALNVTPSPSPAPPAAS